tara:strand:+ start:3546 stop:3746 length:201 start_codon:yes stop_codon:yes gene_type:complete
MDDQLQEISEYLLEKDKTEWALIIQGLILEFNQYDSDIDYSEDEGDALDEGVPAVNIDLNGFQSLV